MRIGSDVRTVIDQRVDTSMMIDGDTIISRIVRKEITLQNMTGEEEKDGTRIGKDTITTGETQTTEGEISDGMSAS